MRLDRALIKSQAKEIIKGQILNLFLISIVVGLLCGGINAASNVVAEATGDTIGNVLHGGYSKDDILDEFKDEFGIYDYDEQDDAKEDDRPDLNHFDDFNGSLSVLAMPSFNRNVLNISSNITDIASFILAPLTISLCGLYVMLIRGNKMKLGEGFSYVFSKTFNENYWQKLLLTIIKPIIIGIMFCLFIIPGIIFYYRYYFADMILADNPNMKAKDALRLSKQMTEGHKGELFALDLSFIGWALLFPLTLGLISIYVTPYYSTTKALYYENFRLRCVQESINPQLAFMTEEEKLQFFTSQQEQAPAEPVVEEPQNIFGSGMDTNYYNGNF